MIAEIKNFDVDGESIEVLNEKKAKAGQNSYDEFDNNNDREKHHTEY